MTYSGNLKVDHRIVTVNVAKWDECTNCCLLLA